MPTDTRHLGYRRLSVDDAPEPATPPAFANHSTGFARTQLLGGRHGAIHTSTGLCDIAPGGRIDPHVHSYGESFYVLSGNPVLDIGGQSIELGPDRCGVLPVGTPHAWRNTTAEPVRFFEMQAPRARETTTRPRRTRSSSPRASPAASSIRTTIRSRRTT